MKRIAALLRWTTLLGLLVVLHLTLSCLPETSEAAIEAALKVKLRTIRDAIGDFERDRGQLPGELVDLPAAGYLYAMPIDPSTGKPDWLVIRNGDGAVKDVTSRLRRDL